MTSCKKLLCAWISLTYFVNPCLSTPTGIATISTPTSESTPNSNSDVTRTSELFGTSSSLSVDELKKVEIKYREILYEEGIKVPTDREMRWARKMAIEMVAHDRTKKEKNDAVKDKTSVEEFAKKLWCPIKIRDEIENLPLTYLPSVQYVRDEVRDVKTLINEKFDKLFPNMFKRVENLKSVAKSSEKVEPFANIWSTLKEFVPQEKSLRLAQNQMQVGNVIVQLAYAKSAQDARTFWRDHGLEGMMSGLKNETLKYLLYKKMILNTTEYFEQNKEREFAEDYIEIERIPRLFGTIRFLTEKHRDCKMVLYFSDHGKIKALRLNLTSIFPDMPFYDQIHEHCANQSSLWDILSVLKLHNVIMQAPTDACRPRPEDYVELVGDLRLKKEIGLANVVEFLIA